MHPYDLEYLKRHYEDCPRDPSGPREGQIYPHVANFVLRSAPLTKLLGAEFGTTAEIVAPTDHNGNELGLVVPLTPIGSLTMDSLSDIEAELHVLSPACTTAVTGLPEVTSGNGVFSLHIPLESAELRSESSKLTKKLNTPSVRLAIPIARTALQSTAEGMQSRLYQLLGSSPRTVTLSSPRILYAAPSELPIPRQPTPGAHQDLVLSANYN